MVSHSNIVILHPRPAMSVNDRQFGELEGLSSFTFFFGRRGSRGRGMADPDSKEKL